MTTQAKKYSFFVSQIIWFPFSCLFSYFCFLCGPRFLRTDGIIFGCLGCCRYWTVTNIDYHNLRTPRRIFLMIFTVWFFAVIVSLAPQFGWKDPEYMQRIEQEKCMVSQDVVYQVNSIEKLQTICWKIYWL